MEQPVAQPGDDWELAKENFQPLKAGRKPGGLRDNTAELRSAAVEEQRRGFWEELASYQGDDPLEVWLRFIKWTTDTFSAGGHKAELRPLLERCTRELQSVPRYQNDVRYLRVWVQYADCLPDPGDVFLFLKENEIGLEHALFYVAYATYLETRTSFAKADAVYQQGINRLAAPVDRLKARFQEFQHRMAQRIQRKAAEQAAGGGEPEHPGRQTLGTITARRSSARGGLPGAAGGLKRKAASPLKLPGQENVPSGSLAVFVDEEFSAEGGPAQSAPAVLFMPGRSAAGPWSKLGSFEQSRKENTQRAGVWAGQKLRQAPAHSAPPAPVLDIPVDPEFEELGAAGAARAAQEPSLRQRLERGAPGREAHLDEALASDPLRLHRAQLATAVPGQQPSRPALQPTEPAAGEQQQQPEAKRRREEVMAFDEAALSANGEELCFEELRARAWQAKGAAFAAKPASVPVASTRYGQPAAAAEVEAAAPMAEEPADEVVPGGAHGTKDVHTVLQQAVQHLEKLPDASPLREQQRPMPASPPAPPQNSPAVPAPPPHRAAAPAPVEQRQAQRPPRRRTATMHEPTMTLATRDAFAAISNMFQGSLPAEHTALPPNPYAEPTMHGFEPTLSTRNAFAAVNNMFKGSLPNEHGALPPRAGFADPTVTISTRAAFDAINGMFGGGGGGGSGALAGGSGSGFSICEDTNFFSVPLPAEPAAAAGAGAGQASAPAPLAAAPAAAFEVREDTQFVRGTEPASRNAGGGFSIREDTQFISAAAGAGVGSGRGGFSIREDTQFISAPAAAANAGSKGGFNIREDTQFISAAPAAALAAGSGGGFSIREDTQFIAAPAAAVGAGDGGGFSIREDTQFISAAPAAAVGAGGRGGFSIREDTQFMGPFAAAAQGSGFSIPEDTEFLAVPAAAGPAQTAGPAAKPAAGLHARGSKASAAKDAAASAAQVSKWGFAPGADDTLQLDLGNDTLDILADTQALGASAPAGASPSALTAALRQSVGPSLGLAKHMRELRLSEGEDKENAATAQAAAAARSIHSGKHAAGTLQPLGAMASADVDSETEAELQRQGLSQSDDSFDVLEMGSQEQLQPGELEPEGASSGAEGADLSSRPALQPVAVAGAVTVADPFDRRFQPAMLASLDPPVLEWPGVHSCTAVEETSFCSVLKSIRKNGSLAAAVPLELAGQEYVVTRFVGAGAYATVYQATGVDGTEVALKLESPPCPWEWYICQALHARLPPPERHRFIDPLRLALGCSASVLVAPYGPCGSLQDMLNKFLKAGQRPDELVAMHFAMELLWVLEGLAAARLVHTDIKPDNLLVVVGAGGAGADENAAPAVALQLIDFGRSVDLELLPAGTLLQGDSGTDAFRCVEMREGRPWLHQADAYGVCGVVHCLLFGEYMEVDRVRDAAGRASLRLRQVWKRYWEQDLWADFFSTLLNHTDPASPPPTGRLLARFQAHLDANPAAVRKLRLELSKLAAMCDGGC